MTVTHPSDYDHPPSFKAAVALAALENRQSLAELAGRYGVAAAQVEQWRDDLIAGSASVFSAGRKKPAGGHMFNNQELALIIAENSTQGLAMMDERGYCIYANRAWLTMTGYSAEEIASRPLHELVHHHYPDGRPYPMAECPIDRALPENFEVRAHEDLFFRKDGSTFSVLCAASPIFENGRPVATVIEIRDITERKRVEEALREGERLALEAARQAESERRRVDAILETVPIGIILGDVHGRMIRASAGVKKIWGERLPQTANVDDYREWMGWWADGSEKHGRPLQAHEWAMARALNGEEAPRDIVDIEPFDQPGIRRTIINTAAAIRDVDGTIVGGVLAMVDITDRVKAEAALRESDRRKDEFIAVLAHELRNPLAPIRSALDIFEIAGPQDAMLKRAQNIMARQIEHMARLIDDLLDVARISRGKIQLKPERCDLVRVVQQATEDYREEMQAKGIRFSIQTAVGPLWVHGDRTRLMQIFSNLLNNAYKFTQAGDEILVAIRTESGEDDAPGDHAVVTVQDSGAGIAPELLPQLFSPFIQANQDLGRAKGGLGLGLALVKGLTELHGGAVAVESAGLGQGARFTLLFPLAESAPSAPAVAAVEKPAGASGGRRIVAIEDNPDIFEMLQMVLTAYGHEVSGAANGTDGIAAVRSIKPDVVICDIGLPGDVDGYAVARALRADPVTAEILLIALSGYGHESDKHRSREAGFDLHFVKPVCFEELQKAIAQRQHSG